MTTLADLLTAPSQDEVKADLLALLAAKSFPTTNWLSGGPERTLVESVGAIIADYTGTLTPIVASWGFLEEATEDALTVKARSDFNTTRKPATTALWALNLTNDDAVPLVLAAGQVWAQNAQGLLTNQTNSQTIGPGSEGTIFLRAEATGTAYNAGPFDILATPLALVTIGDSYIQSSAVDEETDAELLARSRLQWANLGAGSTRPAFIRRALDAVNEVRRVVAVENTPTPGSVAIVIARTDTTATGDDVDAVQAAQDDDNVRPLCVEIAVSAAEEVTVDVEATITILATRQAEAAALVETNLQALLRTRSISDGVDQPLNYIFREALKEVLMGFAGAENCDLTVPADDILLAFGEVATLGAVDITWDTF